MNISVKHTVTGHKLIMAIMDIFADNYVRAENGFSTIKRINKPNILAEMRGQLWEKGTNYYDYWTENNSYGEDFAAEHKEEIIHLFEKYWVYKDEYWPFNDEQE